MMSPAPDMRSQIAASGGASITTDWVLLLARLFLAAVFLYGGMTKLIEWHAAIAEFEGLGIPAPSVAVSATVAMQLLGGLAIVLGWGTRLAASALATFTVVATLIGHPFWAFDGADFQRQLTTALEHLAIVGGFLALAAQEPGSFALIGKETKL